MYYYSNIKGLWEQILITFMAELGFYLKLNTIFLEIIQKSMKLIIGLGNPGQKYTNTRHNIWFACIDEIHKTDSSFSGWKSQFQWLVAEGRIGGEKILLVKPMTYMNLSWQSVASAMQYYKITHEDICVIYDDVDMKFSKIRLRDTGSSGWHNGIKSLIGCIWTQDFPRIKIWVGKHEHMETADWVLSTFSTDEQDTIGNTIFPEVVTYVCDWCTWRS